MPKPTTAIVLAGGLGTRLRAAVSDLPKVLAPAGERPFLSYLLAHLRAQRIETVILALGYRAEQVQAFVGNGAAWGLEVRYSIETSPRGTGGALALACAGLQAPFFALNGDTLFAVELAELWQVYAAAQEKPAEEAPPPWGALALRRAPGETAARGVVGLDPHGRITSFLEKPDDALPGGGLTSGGVYLLRPDIPAFQRPVDDAPVSLERQVFPALAAERRLLGAPLAGYFCDIGLPASLARFSADVQAGRLDWLNP